MTLTNTVNSFVIKDEHIKINDTVKTSHDSLDSNKNIKEKKSKKSKKSKKRKYKSVRSLMKEIMKPKSIEVMRKEHKEKILKNMGGGKFNKLDRI